MIRNAALKMLDIAGPKNRATRRVRIFCTSRSIDALKAVGKWGYPKAGAIT